MIEKKISGNKIVLFDSIEELPAGRHHAYTKYSLMDLGIGSDMQAIANHNRKIDTYLVQGKTDYAIQQRRTQDLSYWYAINEISFSSYALATMVYKINNDFITDFTLNGIDSTITRLKKMGVKTSDVKETVDEIKKNLTQSLGFTSLNDTLTMMN